MKKVSVIIPCYRMKEEWIERIFYMLPKQTIGLEHLEIICVVDASPDDTFDRLKRYEEQYEDNVLLVQCNEKVGPGGARSLGIQYASGEYVAFMDQDDWVESCMYGHLYRKAKEYDCDVVESYNTRDSSYQYHEGEPEGKGGRMHFLCWIVQRNVKRILQEKDQRNESIGRSFTAETFCWKRGLISRRT